VDTFLAVNVTLGSSISCLDCISRSSIWEGVGLFPGPAAAEVEQRSDKII